ncbi:MAG: bifunctional diaminohydroxyphosphoribosylaminopyrimidine deaminase/5-amino-6-(5-phosphoribosylamino)uracil reductase RibD [Pseudomonadota bacterium]
MTALSDQLDRRFLATSIRMGAQRGGRTWPNPAVGCLVVSRGVVVGRGVTGNGGTPHGETVALKQAGHRAQGATVYVSLEPCNHHGRTPPCSDALVAAGVKRVVVALGDPDPRVSGSGASALRQAGITVDVEPFADIKADAERAHRGHIARILLDRPHVTLKLALSADGAIGAAGQGQIAITGEQTNRLMHGLRSRMDAIAVGAGTWRTDKPQLTVRLPGLERRSPRRVVFGGDDPGTEAWHLPKHTVRSNLRMLAGSGIGELLVEGGATLAGLLLRERFVDELLLLKGQGVIGHGAIKPFDADPFDDLARAGLSDWTARSKRRVGDDALMVLAPNMVAEAASPLAEADNPPRVEIATI